MPAKIDVGQGSNVLAKPTKQRKRPLTNDLRLAIRQYFSQDPNRKPTDTEVIQWVESKYQITLTTKQVSNTLSNRYSSLDGANLETEEGDN
jgi:hypothetical protein